MFSNKVGFKPQRIWLQAFILVIVFMLGIKLTFSYDKNAKFYVYGINRMSAVFKRSDNFIYAKIIVLKKHV